MQRKDGGVKNQVWWVQGGAKDVSDDTQRNGWQEQTQNERLKYRLDMYVHSKHHPQFNVSRLHGKIGGVAGIMQH